MVFAVEQWRRRGRQFAAPDMVFRQRQPVRRVTSLISLPQLSQVYVLVNIS